MGLTGSVLGIVKYPFGLGSQHLATTNLIGLLRKYKLTYYESVIIKIETKSNKSTQIRKRCIYTENNE